MVNECNVEDRKHGYWKKDGTCSQCGAPAATDTRFDFLPIQDQKYCYNCGAIMDKLSIEEK